MWLSRLQSLSQWRQTLPRARGRSIICAVLLAALVAVGGLGPVGSAVAQSPTSVGDIENGAASGQFSPRAGGYSTATLRVVTVERRPFAIRTDQGFAGFSIELWEEIARELGRESTFEMVREFPDMLARVRDFQADAAIANITITSAREREMDFSQPMYDAGLRVMIAQDGTSIGLLGALFNLEMLGLVLLAGLLLFGAANLMWLFEHKDQPYFQYPYREGVFRSFWWALNVIVNGGFEERIPQTAKGRVFAVLLVLMSLFIVSAFVAKITATLTVGELQAQIQGYTDLYGRRVGTTRGSTAAAFLDSHGINHRTFDNTAPLFQALAAKQLDAVVHDSPLLEYYAATEGRGRVMVVGSMLRPEKYGIAFPQGSELREAVDRALLKLREDGTYARLKNRWFDRD